MNAVSDSLRFGLRLSNKTSTRSCQQTMLGVPWGRSEQWGTKSACLRNQTSTKWACCVCGHVSDLIVPMLQCCKVGPYLPTNSQGLPLCSKLSEAASESAVTTMCLPVLSALSAYVTKSSSSRYESVFVNALHNLGMHATALPACVCMTSRTLTHCNFCTQMMHMHHVSISEGTGP